MKDLLESYRASHRHPLNRALHVLGIPLVAGSLLLFYWSWRWGLALFVSGWTLQFVGHAFEGKRPAFLAHPVYLVVGLVWWARGLFGGKERS